MGGGGALPGEATHGPRLPPLHFGAVGTQDGRVRMGNGGGGVCGGGHCVATLSDGP